MRMRTLALPGAAVLVAALGVAAPASAAVATPAAAATATYTVTDLGSLGGGVTDATAINASGQVTGYSYLTEGGDYHAFVWSSGKMTDLGTLPGGDLSRGHSINDSGEVVGLALDADDFFVKFLWNGTTLTQDGKVGDGEPTINDSGQIAFTCTTSACELINGTTSILPTPAGFDLCGAAAINNNGQVLGNCQVSNPNTDNDYQGVVWTNGTPTVLPTLGGTSTTTLPHAAAINNSGQVTGTAVTRTGALDGFLWSNGRITDLGATFAPAAINDNGVIVGGQFIDSGGTLQNLNNLIPAGSGYQIQSATGINDNGQIIANATDTATGQQHALLLTPHS